MDIVGDKKNIKARHDYEEEMRIRAEGIGDLEYERQKEEGTKEEEA
jgi:hypothetical protein